VFQKYDVFFIGLFEKYDLLFFFKLDLVVTEKFFGVQNPFLKEIGYFLIFFKAVKKNKFLLSFFF